MWSSRRREPLGPVVETVGGCGSGGVCAWTGGGPGAGGGVGGGMEDIVEVSY